MVSKDHQKWLTKLLGYQFDIQYRPGLENKAADALSRMQPSVNVLVLTTSEVLQLWEIKEVVADEVMGKVVSELQEGVNVNLGYALIHGILCYHGKIVLPSHSPIVTLMLQECHDAKIGGHSGFLKKYKRVTKAVY